jgi:hypothetical protein
LWILPTLNVLILLKPTIGFVNTQSFQVFHKTN